MDYQNINGNYDNRGRRKSKKKKRVYYRFVCIVLCLLIAVTAFGIANLIRNGKEPPVPGKEIAQNNEAYFLVDGGQNETVFPSLASAENSLSVNITAANAIVINADTNETLYQKKVQIKFLRPAQRK